MQNVLVTGANKGIGYEVAKEMAGLGYRVFLGCRDEERGKHAIHRLHQLGISNINLLKLDIADVNSVKKATSELAGRIDALDILINNAAITGPEMGRFATWNVSDFHNVFNTNYFGTIQTTHAMMPLLQKARQPVIVNVSSELGSLAMQTSEGRNPNWDLYPAYAASKTALNTFTIQLAHELKDTKFKINSVTPGYTATDLNNYAGKKTVLAAALAIVRFATINEDGESGKFYREEGEVPW